MIIAMGATFTPSMSGRNTVLIAALYAFSLFNRLSKSHCIFSLKGTKAEKARAWSIPIVNHTWLEDCFVQWRNMTVGVEKYIVFPPGVDFSRMIGERGVGVRGLELCEEEEADETSDESVGNKNAHAVEMNTEANDLIKKSERQDIETTGTPYYDLDTDIRADSYNKPHPQNYSNLQARLKNHRRWRRWQSQSRCEKFQHQFRLRNLDTRQFLLVTLRQEWQMGRHRHQ
jgi:hypothetical protein